MNINALNPYKLSINTNNMYNLYINHVNQEYAKDYKPGEVKDLKKNVKYLLEFFLKLQ